MARLRLAALMVVALVSILGTIPVAWGEHEKELLKTKARAAYLTPDGKVLVAASQDNVRLVYLDIKKSRLLTKKFQPIYLSPDGKALGAIDDSTVTLYDVAKGEAKGVVNLPPAAAIAFCVAPGGKACAYGTLKDLVVVDAASAKETHTFKAVGGQPWSASFSPDGKYLACGTGSQKYAVHVWDMTTKKPVRVFEGVPNVTQAVAFSQDSKVLAASSDEVVKVWDVAAGTVLHGFQGPKDKLMRGLAFGNDGKVLAGACSNGIVTLWDMKSGKALDTINIGVEATRVSMSADGKTLAVIGDDQFARVFDVSAIVGK